MSHVKCHMSHVTCQMLILILGTCWTFVFITFLWDILITLSCEFRGHRAGSQLKSKDWWKRHRCKFVIVILLSNCKLSNWVFWISSDSPSSFPTHSCPPHDGVGLSHILLLSLIPPSPHELLQVLQSPQDDQSPAIFNDSSLRSSSLIRHSILSICRSNSILPLAAFIFPIWSTMVLGYRIFFSSPEPFHVLQSPAPQVQNRLFVTPSVQIVDTK